jgi:hypothetical protein
LEWDPTKSCQRISLRVVSSPVSKTRDLLPAAALYAQFQIRQASALS